MNPTSPESIYLPTERAYQNFRHPRNLSTYLPNACIKISRRPPSPIYQNLDESDIPGIYLPTYRTRVSKFQEGPHPQSTRIWMNPTSPEAVYLPTKRVYQNFKKAPIPNLPESG